MRKLLFAMSALCLILLAGVYIFIPNQIIVSKTEEVESSERIIIEYLNHSNKRRRWWPSRGKEDTSTISDSSILEYEGYSFDFQDPGYNSNQVLISTNNFKTNSVITWTTHHNNMIKIGWSTSIPASYNPIKRFLLYQQARNIKAHMVLIMEHLLSFIVSSKNVYGFNFERQTVQDTILAKSSMVSQSYPETPQIYKLINSVKEYVKKQNATQVNLPMLNISKNEQGAYQTMIALPISKVIKPDTDILINRMVAGNILVAEIKGGPHTITEGFLQMNAYMKDFKLTSPAIPFESLITDRSTEPDTSKWITKIYYPIY
ncbi:MAG: hypothetical protein ACYCZO_02655 [Daejeonella sp.]